MGGVKLQLMGTRKPLGHSINTFSTSIEDWVQGTSFRSPAETSNFPSEPPERLGRRDEKSGRALTFQAALAQGGKF